MYAYANSPIQASFLILYSKSFFAKLEEIEKELERLKSLRHPNLISIYEGKLERCDSGWYLHVLMEHASGGTLLDLLRKCGTIRLEMAREYMKQLLSALDYVHSHNLVHKGGIT